jgi:hypothetical protein
MMTPHEISGYMPLVAGTSLALLGWVMVRRTLHKELPIFFKYICFSAFSAFLLFVLCDRPYPRLYDWSYWGVSFVGSALSFLVMYEVFVRLLRPYAAVIDLAKMLFKWAGAFLLLVALMGALAANGSQPDRIGAAVTMIDRSLMQCGLLMLLVIFEKRLKVSWRSYAASITLGLGVTAAVSLLTSVVGASDSSYNQTLFLAYQVITVGFFAYWGVMLQRPEPQRKNVLDSPSRLVFQRWNEVLSSTPLAAHGGHLALAEVDSFIPGVEKTVERIMARKMTIN